MRKTKHQFYNFINKIIKRSKATGWPFEVFYADCLSKHSLRSGYLTYELFKECRKYAYSKKGRMDGSYEAWTGRENTRKYKGV